MPILLRWLASLVGTLHFVQVLWPPLRDSLGLDRATQARERTERLLERARAAADPTPPPHDAAFRFARAVRDTDALTALFVNEGAPVTRLAVAGAHGSIHPQDLPGGAGARLTLHRLAKGDATFELVYRDPARQLLSQAFVWREGASRIEATSRLGG
jgi:hypothetical protein